MDAHGGSAGRTALVGGASSGIGLATAHALAAAGCDVALLGRRADALEAAAAAVREASGRRVACIAADVADPGGSSDVVARAEAALGPLDVLVLNAGGPPPGRVLAVDDDAWRSGAELLLLGPLRLARAALPGMAERGWGRVVLVTSTAVRQPQPDLAVSVVLRSAATAAVKLLSLEHAARGVTANCVAPGPTDTPRRRAVVAARALAAGTTAEAADAADAAQVPAGRPGRPEEVASAVAYLASDAAAYVNGTVLTVDGGRTEGTW